jgi:dTDP-4-dehydrorhamnose 3,5-epimerase
VADLDLIEQNLRQDVQTVGVDGEATSQLIDGVVIRYQASQIDGRGTLCEIVDLRWDVTDSPIVYVYQFTIRPAKAKGWHVHRLHDDRIFISRGELKVVLYDGRDESPTYGMINEIHRSELRRSLMVIPRGVFHAHVNIGMTDAQLVSMPTRGYDHSNPDVFRLPLDTDLIPYRFEDRLGW